MSTTLDAASHGAMESFFKGARGGMVDISMAGDGATHQVPASLDAITSHMSWHAPGPAISMGALDMNQMFGSQEIDLSSLSGNEPAKPGPQVGGVNYAAIVQKAPKTPGGSSFS